MGIFKLFLTKQYSTVIEWKGQSTKTESRRILTYELKQKRGYGGYENVVPKKKRKLTLAGLAVRFCHVLPVHLTACKIKQPYAIVDSIPQ
jgi:hypothetical protein